MLLGHMRSDVSFDLGSNDQDYLTEAGGDRIVDAEVEKSLTAGSHPSELLDATEAASEAGSHDHELRARRIRGHAFMVEP